MTGGILPWVDISWLAMTSGMKLDAHASSVTALSPENFLFLIILFGKISFQIRKKILQILKGILPSE